MRFFDLIDGKKQRRRIKSKRRRLIYNRDGKRCRYCNKKVKYNKFHVDHIKPVKKHGNDYIFNLCCSCASCNLKKSDNTKMKPNISFWRKVFGLILIFYYEDYPELKDFV